MNRLSNNSEDLVIQQLFYNESRNIIDPQQLYSMIMPNKNPTFKNMMSDEIKRRSY